MPPHVNEETFKLFVEFIGRRFSLHKPFNAADLVAFEDCPTKDPDTARKYLSEMQKAKLHIKSTYPHGKLHFLGCTPEEDVAFKRAGFESWVGLRTEEFLSGHPNVGKVVLERLFKYHEYREPLFPFLAKMFPLASDIFKARTSFDET